jgi:cytochrome c oxidase subunit 3
VTFTPYERRYRIAVWTVIASEALLFAGLFGLYFGYRSEYGAAFTAGVHDDYQWIGGANTIVLLTSSFAIAWAIHATRAGRARVATWCLAAVLVLGLCFLVLKGVEWGLHIEEGIVPGPAYHADYHGRGTLLFFTMYYLMTGLHAAHVVAGMALVAWMFVRAYHRRLTPERHLALDLVALYWHFVDAIWVFLWPMFYLMHG